MDYGITTTAKIKPSQLSENEEEGASNFLSTDGTPHKNNKMQHCLDDEALANVLCEIDPYIELANEALLCANHIENGIAQQAQQSNTTSTTSSSSSFNSAIDDASLPGKQWRMSVPSETEDYGRDHIEMFDTDTATTKYSERCAQVFLIFFFCRSSS